MDVMEPLIDPTPPDYAALIGTDGTVVENIESGLDIAADEILGRIGGPSRRCE